MFVSFGFFTGLSRVFSLAYTGWLHLAQSKALPDRVNALQNNWPSPGSGRSSEYYIILIIAAGAAAALCLSLWIIVTARKRRESKARSMGLENVLTGDDKKIARIIAVNEGVDAEKLLKSARLFDEFVGSYITKYCAKKSEPNVLIQRLYNIRKKLPLPAAAAEIQRPRLFMIPLLDAVEITNLRLKSKGSWMCRVIQKDSASLILLGSTGGFLKTWNAGDQLLVRSRGGGGADSSFS